MRPWEHGWCLLCQREELVVWIGPVEHAGQTAPAYACSECCDFVRAYIAAYTQERDTRPAM